MTMVWLTLAVALVHFALLESLPQVASTFRVEKPSDTLVFSMHTVPTEPAHSPALVAAAQPAPPRTAAKKSMAPEPASEVPPVPDPAATVSEAADALPTQGTPPDTIPATAIAATNATTPDTGTPPALQAPLPSDAHSDGPAQPDRKLLFPPSVRMFFDVKGVVTYAYTGGSELLWLNHGNGYHARLQITKFGFHLRTWTSKGDLTGQGLVPLRFGDKGRSSEIASHFQRDKGIISFSANVPDVLLQEGAQDYLSSFFQLSAMLSGEPERYPPGSAIAFQVAGARGADPWIFHVDGLETLDLPDGPKAGVRLTREHDAKYDTKVELWLAPDLSYLPIRIRLSQGNGDFAELLWRSSQKPD